MDKRVSIILAWLGKMAGYSFPAEKALSSGW